MCAEPRPDAIHMQPTLVIPQLLGSIAPHCISTMQQATASGSYAVGHVQQDMQAVVCKSGMPPIAGRRNVQPNLCWAQ